MPVASEAARVLGRRIADHRRELQATQAELAEVADVHFTNLGKIERGETNPNLLTLIRLAGALGVDLGELVAGLTTELLPEGERTVTVNDWLRERGAVSRRHARIRLAPTD